MTEYLTNFLIECLVVYIELGMAWTVFLLASSDLHDMAAKVAKDLVDDPDGLSMPWWMVYPIFVVLFIFKALQHGAMWPYSASRYIRAKA